MNDDPDNPYRPFAESTYDDPTLADRLDALGAHRADQSESRRVVVVPEELRDEAAEALRNYEVLYNFIYREGDGLLAELDRASKWPDYELGVRLEVRFQQLNKLRDTNE